MGSEARCQRTHAQRPPLGANDAAQQRSRKAHPRWVAVSRSGRRRRNVVRMPPAPLPGRRPGLGLRGRGQITTGLCHIVTAAPTGQQRRQRDRDGKGFREEPVRTIADSRLEVKGMQDAANHEVFFVRPGLSANPLCGFHLPPAANGRGPRPLAANIFARLRARRDLCSYQPFPNICLPSV